MLENADKAPDIMAEKKCFSSIVVEHGKNNEVQIRESFFDNL